MVGVHYYVILHYVGHGFAGWQRQPAIRTVQAELETALERLAGARVVAHAAGRTDAGVHALGQVASFTLPREWEPPELERALRALTPDDMWIAHVGRAPPGFHARRSAIARRYRYVIGCDAAARSPFRRPFEWALGVPLDLERLHAAATHLRGEHDFRGFAASGQVKPHYRCTITVAEWAARDTCDGYIFTVEADRFLHNMVRFLVGTMVDVGRDRRPVDDVPRLLVATENREASPPAPAHGLYLLHVRYPKFDEGA
jgi:tRNA pseudouridine38-40 synthase